MGLGARVADAETVAGIDLGSNSFHMIVVRRERDGKIEVLDKIRSPVRLAAGLNEEREIDDAAMKRGWDALALMGERLRDLPDDRVRAVGTNTLRLAKNGGAFLERGRKLLGHPIETISGIEEARLIFLGVAHSDYVSSGKRFVMDIGGGSTEFIIGEGLEPVTAHSLYMGCVSFSQRYFGDGKLTTTNFDRAELAAAKELRSIREGFRKIGWQHAFGASGTIRSVASVLRESGWTNGTITLDGLDRLVATMIESRKISKLALEGLDGDRMPVFAGGVAVLRAAFRSLGLERMQAASGALREGLAWELLGRSEDVDVRDKTVEAFMERYAVEVPHARRVEVTAVGLLSQVMDAWELDRARSERFLRYAARLHEIGMSIAYSGYQKHDAYIIENATMPGFSRDEQSALAAILRSHRRKLRTKSFRVLSKEHADIALALTLLLRIAIVLHRSRTDEPAPQVEMDARSPQDILLRFPTGYLESHPLVRADLESEADFFERADARLMFA